MLEAEEAALNSLMILRLVDQFHRIERARAKEHCGKKLKRTWTHQNQSILFWNEEKVKILVHIDQKVLMKRPQPWGKSPLLAKDRKRLLHQNLKNNLVVKFKKKALHSTLLNPKDKLSQLLKSTSIKLSRIVINQSPRFGSPQAIVPMT